MSLRGVNLNMIPVLQALLREKSVSRAAKRLNLTQPAVSIALAKLRAELDDPLLVLVGRDMELTPRGHALVRPVEDACAALERVLAPPTFDPGAAVRTFVMATFDYSALIAGPRMIRALAKQAPGISMHFMNWSLRYSGQIPAHVDVMLLPLEAIQQFKDEQLRYEGVFHDQIVYMAGPGNPLYNCSEPTLQDLQEQRTVRFSPGHGDTASINGNPFNFHYSPLFIPEAKGRELALTEQFSLAPLMALLSGSMCEAPRRLVEALQQYIPLRIFDAGLPTVEVFVTWRRTLDSDPGHRWFRELLMETIRDDRFTSPDEVEPGVS